MNHLEQYPMTRQKVSSSTGPNMFNYQLTPLRTTDHEVVGRPDPKIHAVVTQELDYLDAAGLEYGRCMSGPLILNEHLKPSELQVTC